MSEAQTYGEYRRIRDGFDRIPMKKRQRIAPPRDEEFVNKRGRYEPEEEPEESGDSRGFRPSMLNFKAFLLTQDDSITDDEALEKYGEYKLEFNRQQLNAFFVAHKEEEWFREKYHPDLVAARRKLADHSIKERLRVFMEMFDQGLMKELRLETGKSDDIEMLLDCFVLKLESGADEDVEKLLKGEPIEEEFHKTSSIHLKTLHPTVKRDEVEAVCKKYPGFLRLCLSDPAPERKWYRRGWITFTRETKVKEICFSLSSVRLKDTELGPVLNKDLSRRIRNISSLANDKSSMRNDLKLLTKMTKILDKKFDLWETKTDDIIGEQSSNPLLKNITEFLIEEMSAEEDELLGYNEDSGKEGKLMELDEELARVLDTLILYLRMVHSVDFYNCTAYNTEEEMPNRCGIFHARETFSKQAVTEGELIEYQEDFSKRLDKLMDSWAFLTHEECIKLGAKDTDEAVEIFVQANTEELGNDKYLCPLSGKKFKGAEFVRKHIFNKHSEKVDEVKKEVDFFNNYLRDPKRPSLPEKPKPVAKPKPKETVKAAESEPAHIARRSIEEHPRPSIKDRLGYKSSVVQAAQGRKDPRGIVDYSDVDFGDDLFS